MPRPAPQPRRQPGGAPRRIAQTAEGRSDEERETSQPRLFVPPAPPAPPPAPPPVPSIPQAPAGSPLDLTVKDLATLRVLTDPLRLAILGAFGNGGRERAMTVKEIAERIDEGPTKLYRHIKQLEEAGLLTVAGTRLVSGILEKSYRPVYRRIDVDSNLLNLSGQEDEYHDTLSALLEATRMRFVADLRTGDVVMDEAPGEHDLTMEITSIGGNLRPEQYNEVRVKVSELIRQVMEMGEGQEGDPEAIPMRFQVLLYAMPDRRPGAGAPDGN